MVRIIEAFEAIRTGGRRARRQLWPAGRFLDWPHPTWIEVVRRVSPNTVDTTLGSVTDPHDHLQWYMRNLRVMGPPPLLGSITGQTFYTLTPLDCLATDWVVSDYPTTPPRD